jgi:hypothetical protein
MTIVGLTIVVAQLWREVNPLRAEVFRLRQELGYLSIHDENKIYAIQVSGTDPDVRRYRVYIPTNGTFKVYSRIHTIPARPTGISQQAWFAELLKSRSGSTSSVEAGEFTIDVRVRQDPQTKDQWTLDHTIVGKGTGSVGSGMPWLSDRRLWSISGDVSVGKQQEFNPSDGFVLFQLRQGTIKEFKGGYSTTGADETKETPGVMLWIAPEVKGQ